MSNAMNGGLINIEVVFATPQTQRIVKLEIRSDSSIEAAIEQSKLAAEFPDYDFTQLVYGVYGKRIFDNANFHFKDGDRLELYRSLLKSPNQRRLDRAKNN